MKESLVARDAETAVKTALTENGSTWLSYDGNSMLPTLKSGTTVLVERADLSRISARDIIAFEAPSSEAVIVHRLIRKTLTPAGTTLVTKGDHNPHLDSEVAPQRLLGKVAQVRQSRNVDVETIKTDTPSAYVYEFFGLLLLFARHRRDRIPKPFHALLQKTFTLIHRTASLFM